MSKFSENSWKVYPYTKQYIKSLFRMVTERERKEIRNQGTWSPCSSPSTPSSSSFSRPPWPQRWPSQKISRNIFKVSWKRRPYRTSLGEKCFTGKLKIFVCCKWKGRGVLMSCSIFLLLVFHFLYAIPSQQSQERGTKIYLSISALHLIFLLYIACLLYVWRRRNDWKQCKTCSIVVAWPFLDSCPVHNLHTTPLTVYTST